MHDGAWTYMMRHGVEDCAKNYQNVGGCPQEGRECRRKPKKTSAPTEKTKKNGKMSKNELKNTKTQSEFSKITKNVNECRAVNRNAVKCRIMMFLRPSRGGRCVYIRV